MEGRDGMEGDTDLIEAPGYESPTLVFPERVGAIIGVRGCHVPLLFLRHCALEGVTDARKVEGLEFADQSLYLRLRENPLVEPTKHVVLLEGRQLIPQSRHRRTAACRQVGREAGAVRAG